jgi:biotin carboxyl carrier protein
MNKERRNMAREVVEAPIPGKILEVYVKEGDKIEEGDVICTLESMKMENPIVAPVSGVVNEVKVSPEQAIKSGETIAVIEY